MDKAEEAPAPAAAMAPAQADGDDIAVDGAAATKPSPDATDRMVIRTAHVELRSDTPADVIQHAIALAEGSGGFVAASGSRGIGDDVDTAHATLRVPSTSFEALLSALRAEGDLLSETLGGEDVTDAYVDLTARLRSQRALEERLLDILHRVESVDDALSVETQLTRVRTEIERLEGQKRSMEDRVSFATVELTVSSPVRHTRIESETVVSRLDRALDDAGRAFVSVLAGLIRMLGVLVPLGAVFVPIGIAVRRMWARRRARTFVAPPPPPPSHHFPPQ